MKTLILFICCAMFCLGSNNVFAESKDEVDAPKVQTPEKLSSEEFIKWFVKSVAKQKNIIERTERLLEKIASTDKSDKKIIIEIKQLIVFEEEMLKGAKVRLKILNEEKIEIFAEEMDLVVGSLEDIISRLKKNEIDKELIEIQKETLLTLEVFHKAYVEARKTPCVELKPKGSK